MSRSLTERTRAEAYGSFSATAIHKAAEQSRLAGAAPFRVKTAIHLGQFMVGRVGGNTEIDQVAKRQAWTVLEELLERADADAILVSETAARGRW